MSNQEEYKKCKIGEFCFHLKNQFGNIHGKGISLMVLTNIKTMKESARYARYRSSSKDRGIVFNFCPFCGERICEESR